LYERRAARYREGLFVAEGVRTVSTLITHGCRLHRLLVDAGRIDDVPLPLFDAANAVDTRLLAVETGIFRELSDVEAAQAVIGVFAIPAHPAPASPEIVVVLDGIQDPGNLGSILRSCRAARVDAVLLAKGTVDPYSPKVVRGTAGEFAALPVLSLDSPEALRSGDFAGFPGRIVVAGSGAGRRHTEYDWSTPFILVLGSEAAGPRAKWSEFDVDRVRIALDPSVESLNVAAAAAVLLFEARRDYAFD
jgi:TrmH family RNA methyltransferase